MIATKQNTSARFNLLLVLLLVLSVFSGAYYVLRFSGLTMEVDASRQAVSADGILKTGTLENTRAYNNGVGYSALLATLSFVTGMSVQNVQLASSVLIFILILVTYIAYREMLGGTLASLAAALLLLLQPDFLFYVVRGSHERITWMFGLLMLFFLLRSQKHSGSLKQLTVYIVLFHFSFWGMVISNAYFASSYLLAIAIGLVIGLAFERSIFKRLTQVYLPKGLMQRLVIIAASGFILVFIFTNYIYAPVRQYFRMYQDIIDKISVLFFYSEPSGTTTTFEFYATAWRNPYIYPILTHLQWIIAVSGFAAWIWSTLTIKRLDPKQRFLWQMYTSFGVLLALGTTADFAGFLNQNLQLRLFTPFTIFNSAMLVQSLRSVWPQLKVSYKRIILVAGAILTIFAFVATQIKITNDPMAGNAWLFYTPAETSAMRWIDGHMTDQEVWVDTWDHLREVFFFQEGYTDNTNNFLIYYPKPLNTQVILLSERIQYKATRQEHQLPSVEGRLRVYDNGTSWVYRFRPMTPYQR